MVRFPNGSRTHISLSAESSLKVRSEQRQDFKLVKKLTHRVDAFPSLLLVTLIFVGAFLQAALFKSEDASLNFLRVQLQLKKGKPVCVQSASCSV